MVFTEEQKIKFIVRSMKGLAGIGFLALNGYLIYRYVNE
jgi:hypothetical protein